MANTLIQQVAAKIDHTLLKPNLSSENLVKLCHEAKNFGFAGVCVFPEYIKFISDIYQEGQIIGVVGFPDGSMATHEKLHQTEKILHNGATEIDIVLNWKALLDRKLEAVFTDLYQIVQLCGSKPTKVILETSELSEIEIIMGCSLSKAAGAHFVKTSTGLKGGAQLKDVLTMRATVKEQMKIKASGGIRDLASALAFIKAGADRIGTSQGVAIVSQTLIYSGEDY